ncbi:MAG: hypothetical protein FJX73_03375 [Armatimonadetes bacterium]|nr:hypothetical protein [Armatimonadota bacterium]
MSVPSTVRLVAAALLLAAAVAAGMNEAIAASPAPLSSKQEELSRLQRQLETERRRLRQVRHRERRMADEVQNLDRQREATEEQLRRLALQLRRVRLRTRAAAVELARAEAALAQRRGLLASRVVDLHRYGRAGYLDVVLRATSFPEFVARSRLVGAVMREDARLISAYTRDRDRTAALREELIAQQSQLQEVARQTRERELELSEQVAAKRRILEAIMHERAAAEQAVRETEEDSASVQALIQRLQGGAAPARESAMTALIWPLRGPVTSRFGFRRHPLFRRHHFHTGVDISAPRGTPVPAAHAGKVLFAGWYGGYGKLVILDHGDGVSTLYGHLSRISVKTGQNVSRRQVIGYVGSTGYSTGPHLHYEIRRNGRPINPD